MASSSVRMNGSPTPVENIAIGGSVALSNANDTGATTWAWLLLSKPAGSAAVIAAPTLASTSFTADLEGSYLVQLIVNGTLISTGVSRIVATHTGVKILAHNEIDEGDATGTEGWALPSRQALQLIDKRLGLTNRRTVKFTGTTTTGPKLLKIVGTATIPNGDIVPTVDLAATSAGYGALVFFDSSSSLTSNAVVTVVESGWTDLIANPDTLVADDKVYMSSTPGALTKTKASGNSLLIGYCTLVSGGNVRIWFAPGEAGTTDVTLAAVGAVPNANAATITGQVLNLQPASASFPGVVTTGTQTLAGAKTISSVLTSTVASGSDAIKLLDGARFNFSTADASAYLYRSAANTIITPGSFGAGGGGFSVNSAGKITLGSPLSDGTAAIEIVAGALIQWAAAGIKIRGNNVDGAVEYSYNAGAFLASINGFNGLITSKAVSGANAFTALTGARWKIGEGANDYLYSDGVAVNTPGNFIVGSTATAASFTANGASGQFLFSNAAATAGNIISNISAVNAQATSATAAIKIWPQNALDATDWVLSVGTAANAASLFNVAYNGGVTINAGAGSGNVGLKIANGSSIEMQGGAGNGAIYLNAAHTSYIYYDGTQVSIAGGSGLTASGYIIAGSYLSAPLISSAAISGNDAYRLVSGARLNFNTSDTNSYLYRSAVDTIRTPGALTVDGVLTVGSLTTTGSMTASKFILAGLGVGAVGHEASAADGATAIAFRHENTVALANTTAKLASWGSNSVEKAKIYADGTFEASAVGFGLWSSGRSTGGSFALNVSSLGMWNNNGSAHLFLDLGSGYTLASGQIRSTVGSFTANGANSITYLTSKITGANAAASGAAVQIYPESADFAGTTNILRVANYASHPLQTVAHNGITTGAFNALGGLVSTSLATPVNAAFGTASTGGTLVPATYYYRVAALSQTGTTLASTETSQVVGAGTNTNTVTVNWTAVQGASGYNVYGRTTGAELLLAAATGTTLSYIDTGSITPSGALPTYNTTNNAWFGNFATATGSATDGILTGTGGSNSTSLNLYTGGWQLGFGGASLGFYFRGTNSSTIVQTNATFTSVMTSGNNAINLLDGARLNFSTADASAYLYRSIANTIRTPGALTVDSFLNCGVSITSNATAGGFALGSNLVMFDGNAAGGGALAGQLYLRGQVADSSTASAVVVCTLNNLSNATAKLLSIRQAYNAADVAYVDKAGGFVSVVASGTNAFAMPAGARVDFTGATESYISGAWRLKLGGTDYLTVSLSSGVVASSTAGFDAAAVSGSNSLKMLDGARVNFSTADASAYLYRSAANVISTPGTLDAAMLTSSAGSGSDGLRFTTAGARLSLSTGENTYLYRSASTTIRTPASLTVDATVQAANVISDAVTLDVSGATIAPTLHGHLRRGLLKTTLSYTEFDGTAGLGPTYAKIADIPAKTRIVSVIADVTTAFNIPAGAASITIACGDGSGGGNDIYYLQDVTCSTTKVIGDVDSEVGDSLVRATAVQGGWIPSWSAATQMSVGVTLQGGGSLVNLTQGSVTLYVIYERM